MLDPRDPFDGSAFPACEKPLLASSSDQALQAESIAELRRHNVRRAVLDGTPERVAQWRRAAPGLFLPAVAFGKATERSTEELRRLHRDGRLEAFAEVAMQYRGLRADDPRYEPYFALAEELDVPVGIHLGEGPPGAARFPGYEDYRASLTSPFQLEEVLRRHPGLRLYVMHYGSPLVDEMIAMMFTHPGLYVDVANNDWAFPRAQFHDALRRMIDAGFGKRILFGSDGMYWPGAIGEAIRAIEEAPFLDEAQKRDILYHNAARFLRLNEAEIAADHRPPSADRRMARATP
ncbi:amidohydrolase family protein [Pseudoxanthomonas sp. NC8]|nr:amidohydrolase family protein [Pseudoxanthomonas sp. NC8]